MTMRKTSPFLRLVSVLSLALAASAGSSFIGCGGGTGGSGGGGGSSGTPGCFDYASFDGTSQVVHFQADVLPILRTSCGLSASCHGSESGPGGQHYYGPKNSDGNVTADQIKAIFDQSVNQPAVADPTINVITPGDPSKSFLMYKLDGDPNATDQVSCEKLECAKDKSCLSAMPEGGPQLPSDKRNIIRRWIAQGAKND
jgi:hypothetical protein